MELFGLKKKKKKGLLCEVNCIIKMFLLYKLFRDIEGSGLAFTWVASSHQNITGTTCAKSLKGGCHIWPTSIWYSNNVKDSQFPTKSSR